MSVGSIFSSEAKVEVLRTLSGTNRAFSADELEEETTKNIAAVYKALASLREEGIVERIKTEGKKRYYRLDSDREIVRPVEDLFEAEKREYGVKNTPNKVLNIVFNLKRKLVSRVDGLKRIVLFGSTARGDYVPGSDIDLYIVLDKVTSETEDKIYNILESYDHDFSLVIKPAEEFESDFKRPFSSLAESMLKDGYIDLYLSGDSMDIEDLVEVDET